MEEKFKHYALEIRKTELCNWAPNDETIPEYYSVFFDCGNCGRQISVLDSHLTLPKLLEFMGKPAINPLQARIAELEVELETLRAQLKE